MVEKTQNNSSQDVDLSKKEEQTPALDKNAETSKEKVPEKQSANKKKAKSHGFLKCVVFLIVLTGVVFAVPQVRERILQVYRDKIEPSVSTVTEAFKGVAEEQGVTESAQSTNEAVVAGESSAETQETPVETQEQTPEVVVVEPVNETGDFIAESSQETQYRLAELESKIEILEKQVAQVVLAQAGANEVSKKTADLEMQVTRLENEKADTSAVLALVTRVAEAEKRVESSALQKERDAVTMMALVQMQTAAFSGKSFVVEQRALARLTQESPFIAEKMTVLKTYAEKGVWTTQALKDAFDDYARETVVRHATSPDDNWIKKSLTSLKSLIVIRRLDVPENPTSTDGILAAAQKFVNENDLQSAVLTLKNLNNNDIAVMMPWISAAERTIIVQKTIDETIAYVLSQKYGD